MPPVSAIIIGRFNIGEADRILTIFTREQGKMRVSARAVRRIKSRLAGHVELFSETQLWLHEGKTLNSVSSAQLTRGANDWLHRPDRMNLAYLMAQLLDRLSAEGESQPELYLLALELITELSGELPSPLLELGLKLRFLNDLGYRPELGGCIICGSAHESSDFFLSPERGGLVCEVCRVGGYPFSKRAIKLWRLALDAPLSALHGIAAGESEARDSLELLDQFYEYHFGRRFTGQPLGV